MIVLHTWQIISIISICFLFGFAIGRTFGESRDWAKWMNKMKKKRKSNHENH